MTTLNPLSPQEIFRNVKEARIAAVPDVVIAIINQELQRLYFSAGPSDPVQVTVAYIREMIARNPTYQGVTFPTGWEATVEDMYSDQGWLCKFYSNANVFVFKVSV